MLGDLGKLIIAKGFKKLPKVQKSPDLVTLVVNNVKPMLSFQNSISSIALL